MKSNTEDNKKSSDPPHPSKRNFGAAAEKIEEEKRSARIGNLRRRV
jgi:hypothetical protein